MDFQLNSSPRNGSCSIDPRQGTTSTSFHITCPDWIDSDGIDGYSFFSERTALSSPLCSSRSSSSSPLLAAWTSNRSMLTMLAFTLEPSLRVRLPSDGLSINVTSLHLLARIRDTFGATTEFLLPSVSLAFDWTPFLDLLAHSKARTLTAHPFLPLLATGNQNVIAQLLIGQSRALNLLTEGDLLAARALNISLVSTFGWMSEGTRTEVPSSSSSNVTKRELLAQINDRAELREYLLTFVDALVISTMDSLILQSTLIVELIAIPSPLTRRAAVRTDLFSSSDEPFPCPSPSTSFRSSPPIVVCNCLEHSTNTC